VVGAGAVGGGRQPGGGKAGRGSTAPACSCLFLWGAWSRGGESLSEEEKQPFHPDGVGLGTRRDTLVLEEVTCGSRSGGSSRVTAVACCGVWEWSPAEKHGKKLEYRGKFPLLFFCSPYT